MPKAMYVHVPFCRDICTYCDFTRCGYHKGLADKWLEAIKRDVSKRSIDAIKTLYIGGGTPSALSYSQLETLFQVLEPFTKSVLEYTIEVNADSLNNEKIDLLKQYGINRISMGAQVFDVALLKSIQRIADYEMIKDRISALHAVGISNISIDLMYGLPDQTLAMWRQDLEKALTLPISHISLYALTIEKHSKFGREGVEQIDGYLETDMYELAIEVLTNNGFEHYEISNFAKENKRSQHNQSYWRYEDFYGIGCGASGKEKHRYDNTKNLHTYITKGSEPSIIYLSKKDEMFEMLMMNLRLKEGIYFQTFFDSFQCSLMDVYGDSIQQQITKGNLIVENDALKTTKKGMMLLNDVLLEFLP